MTKEIITIEKVDKNLVYYNGFAVSKKLFPKAKKGQKWEIEVDHDGLYPMGEIKSSKRLVM